MVPAMERAVRGSIVVKINSKLPSNLTEFQAYNEPLLYEVDPMIWEIVNLVELTARRPRELLSFIKTPQALIRGGSEGAKVRAKCWWLRET